MPWFSYYFLGINQTLCDFSGMCVWVLFDTRFLFSVRWLSSCIYTLSWVHFCTIHPCVFLQEFLAWERRWHCQLGQLPLENSGWLQVFGQAIEPGREGTVTNPCAQGGLAKASALNEPVGLAGWKFRASLHSYTCLSPAASQTLFRVSE